MAAPVVVGMDRSYWGRAALLWAAEHAAAVGAGLDVRVTTDGPIELAGTIGEARRVFCTTPVRVRSDVDPVSGLIRASRGAAMVVLGCRDARHHGIGLGDAVPPVAAGARCDVVVVGGCQEAVLGAYHRVCVLLGPRADRAVDALSSAGRFATARRADVYVVRSTYSPIGQDDEDALRRETVALARLLPAEPVGIRFSRAQPHELVAGIDDADLLVIATDAELDVLARSALHHARSPVLVAHAPTRRPGVGDDRPASLQTTGRPA